MILETISLANFRGFEQLDLTADPKVTVIAGVNGVGKSAILHALTVLFSRSLPEFTIAPVPRNPHSFTDEDVLYGRTSLEISSQFVTRETRLQAIASRRGVDAPRMAQLSDRLKSIRREFRYAKGDVKRTRELKREEKGLLASQKQGDDEWRLLVITSGGVTGPSADSSRVPSSPRAILRELRTTANPPLAILFTPNRQLFERPRTLASPAPFAPQSAYLDALDERPIRLGEFMAWFHAMETLSGRGTKRRRKVLAHLRDVVSTFIPAFTDFAIEEEPTLRFVVVKDGIRLSFQQLSDGERGLLAILFDITRRLAIANPESDNPVREGAAIVLIDEVELHLHPLWQRQVLKRFAETFASCQFVVTSHSPLVLGEVEGRAIRFLYRDGDKVCSWTPDYAFGLDANRVLEDLMHVESRDPETTAKLHQVAQAIDQEQFDKARALIATLETKIGQDADLVRSKALMGFLEGKEE